MAILEFLRGMLWGMIWALQFICLLLVLRYNLHMFQLEGYKNGEFVHWLAKNRGKQRVVLLPLFTGIFVYVLVIVQPPVLLYIAQVLYIISLFVTVFYYLFLRSNRTKKKLVYTARVKRLLVTDILFQGILLTALVLTSRMTSVSQISPVLMALPGFVYVLLLALQGYVLMLANWINRPIEKSVNNGFIKDAQKRLKQVPNLTVIGVTGSYGKTSLKYFLHTLMQAKYNVLITPESYNTPMGVVKTIRGSLKPTHQFFICEMGARHVGDIKEICDIVHPDHGVITSIGPQHLETFFTQENIVHTKFELGDAVKEKGGKLFLNGDNEFIRAEGENYDRTIYYYGTEQASREDCYKATDIALNSVGTAFTVVTPEGESQRYQMKLLGSHNLVNAVGAIAIAHSFGVSLQEMVIPVRRLQSVSHRMQILDRGPVTIIDDAFNSNPVGAKAAVETLGMFEGVRILVTPGMVELGEREEELNAEFGKNAAKHCDYILLVGKKRTLPIAKGVEEAGFAMDKCISFDRLEEAMQYAYGIGESGHKFILLENDLPDNYS